MSFLSMKRLDPAVFLQEVGLLEDYVGEDLPSGGDYGGAGIVGGGFEGED